MAWTQERLLRLLRPLNPLPPGVLVVGSCALSLYQLRLGQGFGALTTLDLDLAIQRVPDPSRRRGIEAWCSSIPDGLASLGYQVVRRGTYGMPEYSVMQPTVDRADWPRVELMVDDQDGERRSAPGRSWLERSPLKPQKVGKLALLFSYPWEVLLESDLAVLVPNPLCFVAQKGLIVGRGDRRLKDDGSILRTSELFADRLLELDSLRAERSSITPRRHLQLGMAAIEGRFCRRPFSGARNGLRALGRSTSESAIRQAAAQVTDFLRIFQEKPHGR